MNFTKIFLIARWEFFTRVKSFSFLLSLILTPLLALGLRYLPQNFSSEKKSKSPEIFLLAEDSTDILLDLQENIYRHYRLPDGNPEFIFYPAKYTEPPDSLIARNKEKISSGEIDGIIFLETKNFFRPKLKLYSVESNEKASKIITREIEITLEENFLRKLQPDARIEISAEEKILSRKENFFRQPVIILSFVMIGMYVLIIAQSAQIFIRGIYEERSSRLIEILLGSTSGKNIFFGKLSGIGALSFVQMVIWTGFAAFGIENFSQAFSLLPVFFLLVFCGFFIYASWLLGIGVFVRSEYASQMISGYAVVVALLPALFLTELGGKNIFLSFGEFFPLFSAPIAIAEAGAGILASKEIFFLLAANIFFAILSAILAEKIFSSELHDKNSGLRFRERNVL